MLLTAVHTEESTNALPSRPAVQTACVYKECVAFANQTSELRGSIYDRIENRDAMGRTVNIRSIDPMGGGGFRMNGHLKGLLHLNSYCPVHLQTRTLTSTYENVYSSPNPERLDLRHYSSFIISGCKNWPHLSISEQRAGSNL